MSGRIIFTGRHHYWTVIPEMQYSYTRNTESKPNFLRQDCGSSLENFSLLDWGFFGYVPGFIAVM
jgi:hypothetical protein